MAKLGLEKEIVDRSVYDRTVARFREAKIVLPTFAELADPTTIAPEVRAALADVDPDAAHPLNLFRVHWWNDDARRGIASVPRYVVAAELADRASPPSILVALGDRFPMIDAHKVLAAYGCLVPRLVTGQFDPTAHRAVWPSTGNYCRGGVAISRILGCHGVAVLPAGMSRERFDWLEKWCLAPEDIVRTPGTESNVKEIYDECARIDQRPPEHRLQSVLRVRELPRPLPCHRPRTPGGIPRGAREASAASSLAAFTSATGSAGTLAAGDWLKEQARRAHRRGRGDRVPDPPLQRLRRAQHPGDRRQARPVHPQCDEHGHRRRCLRSRDRHALRALQHRRRAARISATAMASRETTLAELVDFGFSGIANVLAAIKTAKRLRLGPDDAIVTVATDGAAMYGTERDEGDRKALSARLRHGGGGRDVQSPHARDRAPTISSSSVSTSASGCSISATSPGSSSRGWRSPTSTRGRSSRSGAGSGRSSGRGTR